MNDGGNKEDGKILDSQNKLQTRGFGITGAILTV